MDIRTRKQSGAAGEDDLLVESAADIKVGFGYGSDKRLVDPRILQSDEARVEKDLGRAEAFGADLDAVAVGKDVARRRSVVLHIAQELCHAGYAMGKIWGIQCSLQGKFPSLLLLKKGALGTFCPHCIFTHKHKHLSSVLLHTTTHKTAHKKRNKPGQYTKHRKIS